jgi:cytochrome c peroxidase
VGRRILCLAIAAGIAASVAEGAPEPFDWSGRLAGYQRPARIPFPSDNGWSEARETLGRTLYFDPRLSQSATVSCATCHNPALSWGDGLPRAVGHAMKTLRRRSPTVLNLAWGELFFWDGRAESLEEQALGPITSPDEMNLTGDELLARLRAVGEYRSLFEAAYPDEGITLGTVAKALATFERTLVSAEAPFDRWVKGDETAVSEAAKRGFRLFETKARCASCHSGWRFTDESFHDIGLPGDDVGRAAVLPGIDVMRHAFKTPTLRNVARRAPYMHDGSEKDLEAVVDLYVRGGREKRPSLSDQIEPLDLGKAERRDLIEFLHSLTSEDPIPASPRLPL